MKQFKKAQNQGTPSRVSNHSTIHHIEIIHSVHFALCSFIKFVYWLVYKWTFNYSVDSVSMYHGACTFIITDDVHRGHPSKWFSSLHNFSLCQQPPYIKLNAFINVVFTKQ